LLIHTPIRLGEPQCHLYWLDLTEGWELAQLAYRVRERKGGTKKLVRVGDEVDW
jgi:hypothetical protein